MDCCSRPKLHHVTELRGNGNVLGLGGKQDILVARHVQACTRVQIERGQEGGSFYSQVEKLAGIADPLPQISSCWCR